MVLTGLLLAGPRTAAGLFATLQSLPGLIADIHRIAENTDCLPQLHEDMRTVADHTRVLGVVSGRLEDVSMHTSGLRGVESSTQQIAGAMPVLIGLQDQLPAIVPLLEDLSQAMKPIGRLADRFPGRSGNGKWAAGPRRPAGSSGSCRGGPRRGT